MQMSRAFIDAPLGLVTFKTINKTQMLTKVQISLTPDVYLCVHVHESKSVCVRAYTDCIVCDSVIFSHRKG